VTKSRLVVGRCITDSDSSSEDLCHCEVKHSINRQNFKASDAAGIMLRRILVDAERIASLERLTNSLLTASLTLESILQ
jgi:hypothetical protein